MAPGAGTKSAAAFRTIGEVAETTGVAAHVLRYWEGKFAQLRPLTRAGNRRYYRPEDIALVVRIHGLLEREGYTIRGVQTLLANEAKAMSREDREAAVRAVRDTLSRALAAD